MLSYIVYAHSLLFISFTLHMNSYIVNLYILSYLITLFIIINDIFMKTDLTGGLLVVT